MSEVETYTLRPGATFQINNEEDDDERFFWWKTPEEERDHKEWSLDVDDFDELFVRVSEQKQQLENILRTLWVDGFISSEKPLSKQSAIQDEAVQTTLIEILGLVGLSNIPEDQVNG